MNCTDCGCPLHCHDSGWCYNEGCCRGSVCEHAPLKFDATTPSGRWTLADATGDSGTINLDVRWPEWSNNKMYNCHVEAIKCWPEKPRLRVVVAYGTRPEKIKLAPVTSALRDAGVEVFEWRSGQHADLLDKMDRADQWWMDGLVRGISITMEEFYDCMLVKNPPQAVIVQGDTATAFACAQAAWLASVPVAHVEAGMRTYQREPFPEEGFRRQIGAIARWHFAPDADAADNIYAESGDNATVHVVGNTVIDTLPAQPMRIFCTLHRRENWGARIRNAIKALQYFAAEHPLDAEVTIVRHPNWSVQGDMPQIGAAAGVWIVAPMEREALLDEMRISDLIVTDSGGLQEEAAHFGVPTLVLRTATERTALERTGAITIIDPDSPTALRDAIEAALAKRTCYGDGTASKKIASILMSALAVKP